MNYTNSGARRLLAAAFAAIAITAIFLPTSARADVTGGDSRSYGVYVSLTLIGIPVLQVPEQPVSSGSAPGPYNDSDQVLSFSAGAPPIASLGTSVMDTTASSDIDGTIGSRFANSTSLVDDLTIDVVQSAFAPSLLTVSADTIGSTSTASGDFGSMSAVGTMVLENLAIAVSGNSLVIPIAPDPNTVLWDAAGLRVVLNEQTSSVGFGSASIDTNAIHIRLTDIVFGGGLLSGDIIVAHSDASMASTVPEPATVASFGLLTLGALALRRRRK
jgi:hypothetical protein